jgi:enoyl-CoA hydratase
VNALRTRTFEDLEQALVRVSRLSDCRAVVLRSAVPGIFSAGADLKEPAVSADAAARRRHLVRRVLTLIVGSPQPVICVLDGPVRGGGCALASSCDIRVASERTTFGLPEITVGRTGGARHLMRVLPQGEVRLAYFTGQPIAAADAHRLGMVQRLTSTENDAADAAGMALARAIAAQSGAALRAGKAALDLAEQLSLAVGYEVEQQFGLGLSAGGG